MSEHLECPNKSANQLHPAKRIDFDFYSCPHLQPHLQNCLIQKIFLNKLPMGQDISNQNKIINMADTFLDMTTNLPVPILSGIHNIDCNS